MGNHSCDSRTLLCKVSWYFPIGFAWQTVVFQDKWHPKRGSFTYKMSFWWITECISKGGWRHINIANGRLYFGFSHITIKPNHRIINLSSKRLTSRSCNVLPVAASLFSFFFAVSSWGMEHQTTTSLKTSKFRELVNDNKSKILSGHHKLTIDYHVYDLLCNWWPSSVYIWFVSLHVLLESFIISILICLGYLYIIISKLVSHDGIYLPCKYI